MFSTKTEYVQNCFRREYDPSCRHGVKPPTLTHSLHFGSNNTEHYNLPFTLEELNTSIKRAHSTAVGPDKIHYDFLKHLPVKVLKVLLGLFNNIWKSGQIPASWKEATVIPIPKPGKDHKNPTNYRPIALTSCLCKTMERMVNARLVWLLESEHLISDFQSGFRRGRSTLDHLVSLESFVREAFIKKEHAVAGPVGIRGGGS